MYSYTVNIYHSVQVLYLIYQRAKMIQLTPGVDPLMTKTGFWKHYQIGQLRNKGNKDHHGY